MCVRSQIGASVGGYFAAWARTNALRTTLTVVLAVSAFKLWSKQLNAYGARHVGPTARADVALVACESALKMNQPTGKLLGPRGAVKRIGGKLCVRGRWGWGFFYFGRAS
jgi:hypothetical protein